MATSAARPSKSPANVQAGSGVGRAFPSSDIRSDLPFLGPQDWPSFRDVYFLRELGAKKVAGANM